METPNRNSIQTRSGDINRLCFTVQPCQSSFELIFTSLDAATRGPGRPKTLKSDGSREKVRVASIAIFFLTRTTEVSRARCREQLRIAQDTYRARKQTEYTEVKKQNRKMEGIATSLGTSLVELLDQLAAGNTLQENYALAQKVAVSVRDTLHLVQVLQADILEDETDVNPPANAVVPIPTLAEIDTFQDMEPEPTYPVPLNASALHKSQSQETILSQRSDGHSAFPMSSEEIDSFLSSQPVFHQNEASNIHESSSKYQQTQDSFISVHDLLSAKSLLFDRAIDPYNLYVYKEASLAEKIEHSAPVRAGWLLQDPATTMDLVYQIFPFDKKSSTAKYPTIPNQPAHLEVSSGPK